METANLFREGGAENSKRAVGFRLLAAAAGRRPGPERTGRADLLTDWPGRVVWTLGELMKVASKLQSVSAAFGLLAKGFVVQAAPR